MSGRRTRCPSAGGGEEKDAGPAPAPDKHYLDVIRGAHTLSEESKDRYLRSLENLVRFVALTRQGDVEVQTAYRQGRLMADILRSGKTAIEDLHAYYQKYRNGSTPSDSTVSSHCVAALALIKRLSNDEADALGGADHLHAVWESCNAQSSMNIREKYDNWLFSDHQRENFVPWEQLIAKREELGRDARTYASPVHVLLSFLTMMPPMRTSDYSSLLLYDEEEPSPDVKCAGNYVRLRKSCGRLVINEYKTATHYRRMREARKKYDKDNCERSEKDATPVTQQVGGGSVIRIPKDLVIGGGLIYIPKGVYDDSAARREGDLPPALFRILKTMRARRCAMMKHEKSNQWVFLNTDGKPYTGRTFGMMVNRSMKQLFGGKAVTVNLFRHAATNWLDENYRHNKPILVYFRHWMMHSAGMQREYVLANGAETEEMQNEIETDFRKTNILIP